jgi:secreted trypsin-like serine protease
VASRRQRAARVFLPLVVAVAVISLPAAARAKHMASGAASRQRAHAAVIGGRSAETGTFPWMAYILDAHGDEVEQCSGTVVAPNLVLTAGHCAESMQTGAVNEPAGYQVVTGNVDWAAAPADRQVSGVSRVIACSCFDRHTLIGDVALLVLSTPTTALPITLAASPRAGTAALFAGWGQTYPNQATQVERLQWAPTVVYGPQSCERQAPPFSPASELCVIDPPNRQTGACKGDSGGPLLMRQPAAVGGMVQIGLASHVYGDCATTSPSVFTRVDAVSAWVSGWAQALAPPEASSSVAPDGVAAPALAGIASSRSLTLRNGAISLVLRCDAEGGVCAGTVNATVALRVRLVAWRGDSQTVSTSVRNLRLIRASFAIAPGASTVVRTTLSAQSRALLSRLGGEPVEVMLAGQGIPEGVMTLTSATR